MESQFGLSLGGNRLPLTESFEECMQGPDTSLSLSAGSAALLPCDRSDRVVAGGKRAHHPELG